MEIGPVTAGLAVDSYIIQISIVERNLIRYCWLLSLPSAILRPTDLVVSVYFFVQR